MRLLGKTMNYSSHGSILCGGRVGADRPVGTGIGADPGAVLEEDFFEGPVLVGPEERGGSDLVGGPVLGFSDQEDQIVAGPVQEFEGVLGFGGGVDLGGLKFLNLLHIVSNCYGYTIGTDG